MGTIEETSLSATVDSSNGRSPKSSHAMGCR